MQINEFELFRRIRNNDEFAFRIIFEKYYEGLCVYIHGFIPDKDMAKDIVQKVFINIWEKRKDINLKTSLSSYLFRAVRNESINYLKKNSKGNSGKKLPFDIERITENLKISREEGLSILIAQELKTKYLNAVEELPEQCRIVFKLSRFEGLSHKQITDKLDISLNTVEKQISRALQKLRIALKEYIH